MDAAGLYVLLSKRYAAPEWVLCSEVANTTGINVARRADAVALNLYPSRGLTALGFEIKVSRSDWLRELKNPAKADTFACLDYWWIVASEPGIVIASELPLGWGLLVPQGGKLAVVREAMDRTAKPLSRGFAWALIRAVLEQRTPAKTHAAQLAQAVAEERDRTRSLMQEQVEKAKEDLRLLRYEVQQAQYKLTCSLSELPDNIADLVKLSRRDYLTPHLQEERLRLQQKAKMQAAAAREEVEKLEALAALFQEENLLNASSPADGSDPL